ncbi:DUF3617 family protein [Pseudomonas sp. P867]|uniref:DUF3617 domain-containing protein n=1 Tax=Pseudomonas sp. P867 TaxID=2816050 RepID=UPI001CA6F661|nr:DUF3617 family protein [Pseudomonas sp. P867]MBY8972750.1 DUF3617 family protein [Pseudomonas sp. P867]
MNRSQQIGRSVMCIVTPVHVLREQVQRDQRRPPPPTRRLSPKVPPSTAKVCLTTEQINDRTSIFSNASPMQKNCVYDTFTMNDGKIDDKMHCTMDEINAGDTKAPARAERDHPDRYGKVGTQRRIELPFSAAPRQSIVEAPFLVHSLPAMRLRSLDYMESSSSRGAFLQVHPWGALTPAISQVHHHAYANDGHAHRPDCQRPAAT